MPTMNRLAVIGRPYLDSNEPISALESLGVRDRAGLSQRDVGVPASESQLPIH